jgi:hypothetical protein
MQTEKFNLAEVSIIACQTLLSIKCIFSQMQKVLYNLGLHAQGVVHGNLTPATIYVDYPPRVIADRVFGRPSFV